MKKIVLKTYTKLIAWLLSIIGGMQACDIGSSRVEYGTPSADYNVSGKVTDKKTHKPIKGIRVIYKSDFLSYDNDTVVTNAEGSYNLNLQNTFPTNEIAIHAEDFDGEANGGLFAGDSVKIRTSEMQRTRKAKGNWDEGAFEKKDVDFELKPEDPAN